MVRIFILVAGLVFLWFFIKYFEQKSVYFPTKGIEATPEDIGLEYEDVFFKTTDGVRLNGWFISNPKAKATLIFCHGNGGNISHRLESISGFHKIGLNIFIFDYRGYGRSGGRISEEGTYLDAVAAYNYIISREDVNKDAIIAFGRSLGCPIVIELANRVKVAALICESSFTSIMDMTKKIYKVRIPRYFLFYKYDALSKIKSVDVPKLIIHSKDDEMIPFYHGEQLFQASKEPKELYALTGSHNEGFLIASYEYLENIKAFIERIIKGK
ncbi:alpha/beta hydrolase [candidate division WOR-3 bacterium]|nr:alpha/beta hydrolase [candidate division WOR-3 bacterium]